MDHLNAVDIGQFWIPVIGVGLHRQLLAADVFDKTERAGAGGDSQLAQVIIVGGQLFGRIDDGVIAGHDLQEVGGRLLERKDDGLCIRGTYRCHHRQLLFDAGNREVGWWIDDAVKGSDHIIGVKRGAVMEGNALAQGKGIAQLVIRKRPGFGQGRDDRAVAIDYIPHDQPIVHHVTTGATTTLMEIKVGGIHPPSCLQKTTTFGACLGGFHQLTGGGGRCVDFLFNRGGCFNGGQGRPTGTAGKQRHDQAD